MRKREFIWSILQVKLVVALIIPTLAVAKATSNHIFASELSELYGISEEEAITRLAREADANDLAAIIATLDVPGYAGSWFDGEDLILKVGTTSLEGQDNLRRLGAEPVLVRWTIEELRGAYRKLSALHKSRAGAGALIRRLAVNYRKKRH